MEVKIVHKDLIKKHLGCCTPDWIIENCEEMLKDALSLSRVMLWSESETYFGTWSGYEIRVVNCGRELLIKTKQGVRGLNIPVNVYMENNIFHAIDSKQKEIEIVSVYHVLQT